ncbi:MAG: hydrogenase expression/formation protein HypE [Pseudomonadota bacterium]
MKKDCILLDHGSGGKASSELIRRYILPGFDNAILSALDDGAVWEVSGKRIAFSTDTYVVDPIFFPGGTIGDLAVNGTVNDLAMCGALEPYLSSAFIMEEGFPLSDLERIVSAMKAAADRAGVLIVTGDTKVVPKGSVDKIFVNTAGVGLVWDGANLSGCNARPGDKILVSGAIADHGMAVLIHREGISFNSSVQSDTAPLNHMVKGLLSAGIEVHVLRDPTRGGLATSLNEIAQQSGVEMLVHEERIPIRKEVAAACELLGFDPLYVANEGKLVAFVAEKDANTALDVLQSYDLGKDAVIIGEVLEIREPRVLLKTNIGGVRIVGMLAGEQLPRIC